MKTDTKRIPVASESRKIRKPLMEKKRRARINDSLETLKQILLESRTTLKESRGRNGQRTAKLEKADILEMTVSYLQHLHAKVNGVKQQYTRSSLQTQDNCVTLIPTQLRSGEVFYFLPSNLAESQKKVARVDKPGPADTNNIWRPW